LSKYVIDASVAIKWVVQETGTEQALTLRRRRLMAPDLIAPEWANILWKKVRLAELDAERALLSARVLERAEIELHPMRSFLAEATQLAVALDHPAYDCTYLALALRMGVQFVTADARFLKRVRERADPRQAAAVLSLFDVST